MTPPDGPALPADAAVADDSGGVLADIRRHFSSRGPVIVGLLGLLLLAYGFELFSFNLTIDEEIHASYFDPAQWVSQRRWGMYVLNRLLLPYDVVPVVPLAIGLVFHFLGVLVLLYAWDVKRPGEQFLVGALAVTVPTMAYMYTFATIGYGMGAGLFASALSIAIFSRSSSPKRYLAALPAGFAIALYQTFGLALVCAYLVWLVRSAQSGRRIGTRTLLDVAGVGIAAGVVYVIGQVIAMAALDEQESDYLEQFIDLGRLRADPAAVIGRVVRRGLLVYRGDESVFAHTTWALPLLLVLLAAFFVMRLISVERPITMRLVMLIAFPLLLAVPFLGGLLSGGNIQLRFLVALPIALAGVMAVALPFGRVQHAVVVVVASIVLLQFVTSSNSLFGASHLALEQDRALAAALIPEIEAAMAQAETPPTHLEVVGIPAFPATPLVPHSETFGASFFEWDGGNVYRIIHFLKTLGFHGLSGLPVTERGRMVARANSMPDYPAPGSVVVEGEVVVVKFGPYTTSQIQAICRYTPEVSICDP